MSVTFLPSGNTLIFAKASVMVCIGCFLLKSLLIKLLILSITTAKSLKKDFIEYLGWGVGIKWTPYRRALLTNPKIYDTMSKDPVYKWIK